MLEGGASFGTLPPRRAGKAQAPRLLPLRVTRGSQDLAPPPEDNCVHHDFLVDVSA